MSLKDTLKTSSLYNVFQPWRELFLLRRWLRTPTIRLVPQVVKRAVLFEIARERGIDVLIETGTYLGDTVAYASQAFREVHSIEIDRKIHERARRIFGHKSHVHLHLGDSAKILPALVSRLDRPAIFWLDGHFSAHITGKGAEDTPIAEELQAIFDSNSPHAIVIDDAREFGTDPAYPTLESVKNFVKERSSESQIFVVTDVIVILPGKKI